MWKNKKIGVKLGMLVGFMSVLLISVGVYLLHGISATNASMVTNMELAKQYTNAVGDADEVQKHSLMGVKDRSE